MIEISAPLLVVGVALVVVACLVCVILVLWLVGHETRAQVRHAEILRALCRDFDEEDEDLEDADLEDEDDEEDKDDLYAVLGVPRAASADDLKRAYRARARQYHPDKHPGDESAEEAFKEVVGAYQILSDAEQRAVYDHHGIEGIRALETAARVARKKGGAAQ